MTRIQWFKTCFIYKRDAYIMKTCAWYINNISHRNTLAEYCGRTYHRLAVKWNMVDNEEVY